MVELVSSDSGSGAIEESVLRFIFFEQKINPSVMSSQI